MVFYSFKCVMISISRLFIMLKLTGTRLTRLRLDFDWSESDLAFVWLCISFCDPLPVGMLCSQPHYSY